MGRETSGRSRTGKIRETETVRRGNRENSNDLDSEWQHCMEIVRPTVTTQIRRHHCKVHPSREATQRCAFCGSWICERCVRPGPWGEVCSLRCAVLLRLRKIPSWILNLLKEDVPPLLSISILLCLSFMLLSALFRLHGELVEIGTGNHKPKQVRLRKLEVSRRSDGVKLRVEGPPGSLVLIGSSTGKTHLLKTDSTGQAELKGLDRDNTQKVDYRAKIVSSEWDLERSIEAQPAPAEQKVSKKVTATQVARKPSLPPVRPAPTPTRLKPTPPPRFRAAMRAATTPTPFYRPRTFGVAPSPIPTITPTPPRRRIKGPPVLHLVTDAGPRIALTFDGGSSANRTAELLDLLQSLDIHATLFLTGEFIEEQPGLVRRAVLAGHEIGNHTYSHPHLTTYAETHTQKLIPGMTRERFIGELHKTEEVFRRTTGRAMAPLWRAPFGEENSTLRAWALGAGYLHVRWSYLKGKSLDTLDWVDNEHSSLYRNSREIVERLLKFPHLEGGIVLMHLSTDRAEVPWDHLPEFIEALHRRKIQAVQVSTLLEHSHTWKKWFRKAQRKHRELYESN